LIVGLIVLKYILYTFILNCTLINVCVYIFGLKRDLYFNFNILIMLIIFSKMF